MSTRQSRAWGKRELGRTRCGELQDQGTGGRAAGKIHRGCDGYVEVPAGGEFSKIRGAVDLGDRARRRALRPVGGLLPDKRDGAAGVAQEVGCVCRSSLIRPSCAVSLLL